MKTTRQWLEQAKSEGYGWAEQALNNMVYNDLWDSLSEALFSFSWGDSPQGEAYWAGIYDDIHDRELNELRRGLYGNGYLPISDSRNNILFSMKPILDWLNEAKEQGYEWADAAIRNYDPKFMPIRKTNSLIASLENAFVWEGSPEGHDYWRNVIESLRPAEETASLEALTKSLRKLNNAIEAYEEQLSEVKPISLEVLIEDLGKLNSAIGNLAYNDTLKEPYRTQIYDATKASYEEQLAEVKSEIAKRLGIEPIKERKLIGWVVANTIDMVYLIGKPEKVKAGWSLTKSLTPEEAIALCGRVPKWSDEEPIPIYEK